MDKGDQSSYSGKRAVVTGASSGIGLATVRLLQEQGAEIIGLDRQEPTAAIGTFLKLDLADPATIDSAIAQISGPIDALFNCAGRAPGPAPIEVIKVNFIGTRHLTERLLPLMELGGAIVNVASNGGAAWPNRLPALLDFVATPSFDAALRWCEAHPELAAGGYRFSKEAMIVWTLSAAQTLIQRQIRMNCTSPGAVSTPMLAEIETTTAKELIDIVAQPIGRRSSAEEQAHPLLFLNSDAASYINGAILPVDGGFAAGRLLDESRRKQKEACDGQ